MARTHKIYEFVSPNGKRYIGYTGLPITSRLSCHRSRLNNGWKHPLYSAMKKYGFDNFEFNIVLKTLDRQEALSKEKELVKSLNTKYPNGYNLSDGGEMSALGYKCTEEQIETRRKNCTIRMSNPREVERMKKSCLKYWSDPKNREKLAIAHGRSEFGMFKDGKLIDTFINSSDCSRKYNLSVSCIGRCLNRERKTHKGYTFKYLEDAYGSHA